jgi:hypothetical protein
MKSRFPVVEFKINRKKDPGYRGVRDRGACPPRVFKLKVVKRGGAYEAEHYDQPFKTWQELTEQAIKDGWGEIKMGCITKVLKMV